MADFDLKVAVLLPAAKVESEGCVLNGTTGRSSLQGEKEGLRGEILALEGRFEESLL